MIMLNPISKILKEFLPVLIVARNVFLTMSCATPFGPTIVVLFFAVVVVSVAVVCR